MQISRMLSHSLETQEEDPIPVSSRWHRQVADNNEIWVPDTYLLSLKMDHT